MKARFCAICGRLAPTRGDEHISDGWFHFDPDGRPGPIRPVWFCGSRDEAHSDEAVAAVIRATLAAQYRGQAVPA